MKKYAIHLICGGLTLLMVLSTYLFYDETAGTMRRQQYGLPHMLVDFAPIANDYRLVKEIQLSDFAVEIGGEGTQIFVTENSPREADVLVLIESVDMAVALSVRSGDYLDESGEFIRNDAIYLPDCVGGECVSFTRQSNLSYTIKLICWEMPAEQDKPAALNGVVKIYERIGGGENE